MKIAFYEVDKAWKRDYLRGRLDGHLVEFTDRALTPSTAMQAADADAVSVFIYSRIDRAALDALPRLRCVATRSTGFDHIDTAACRERGIVVSNVPHYGENTVAEHTFALILALSRKVHKAYVKVRAGDFSLDELVGFDIKGKTLGVVGAGHIGLHVIKIARGFGMRVLAYDTRPHRFLPEVMDFAYVDLPDLYAASDIVSLHAPYTPQTHHMINRDSLKQFKPGAILINTARGALVETEALIEALDEGRLGGAGLDVIEGEEDLAEEEQLLRNSPHVESLRRVIEGHVLLRKENVVFTPHNAFNSIEATERILETTADNLAAFAAGRPLNLVS